MTEHGLQRRIGCADRELQARHLIESHRCEAVLGLLIELHIETTLHRDDLPEHDIGTRLTGVNYELTAGEESTLGAPWFRTFANPEDALRRDFTVNGMFFDPIKEQLLDYVGGQADLQNRVLRAIGDPGLRFQEDKLRLLRAVRVATRFDLVIEPATAEAETR